MSLRRVLFLSRHFHLRYTKRVPSIYSLKPLFQAQLRPLVRVLARAGVTANQVTLFACGLSVGTGSALAVRIESRAMLAVLPALLFVRMALNAIDGMLAREFAQRSDLGTYLNELTDVVSDAFLYLPFALLPEFDTLWMGALIVLAVMSEMAGTVAVMAGASRRYDGPMGKSDRAAAFGAMAAWLGLGGSLAPWFAWLFPRLLALLLAATIVNRVRGGLAETASVRAASAQL
jgi:CDP-diacylglycerol---glycerol-3-phosphate 3-phosphatidyltransferase